LILIAMSCKHMVTRGDGVVESIYCWNNVCECHVFFKESDNTDVSRIWMPCEDAIVGDTVRFKFINPKP